MQRRTALQLISIALLDGKLMKAADVCGPHSEPSSAPYILQFFSQDDLALVDRMMELIIPEDDHSPGAHAANTAQFADLILAHSKEDEQETWIKGLKALKTRLAEAPLEQIVAEAAANETHPHSDLDDFFVAVKLMTVNGYYTSAIGIHQDLQYQGNTYLLSFPGCTDPEVQEQ